MYFNIKVVTNASQNEIIAQSNGVYLVKVTATAERGKANKKMLELLAAYFNVAKSDIGIVKGKYCAKKLININKHK